MSEFTNHKDTRVSRLEKLFDGILKGDNLGQLIAENEKLIRTVLPSDIIFLVDKLVLKNIPMKDLKKGINKLLNLLYKSISEHQVYQPKKDSFFGIMTENNRILDEHLKEIKPLLRQINNNETDTKVKQQLSQKFTEINKFVSYYQIKENVVFPVIEKYIPEFRCLSVMWSFHDDIKRNLRKILEQLESGSMDLHKVNKLSGDLFFNIYAIKFREERILFPYVMEVVEEDVVESLIAESMEIGFPYYQPENKMKISKTENIISTGIDLETGVLAPEQIKLLFNHLPVDITYVDQNNKVIYYSTPKKRIFPRTKSVIGRDVNNCHPPESVHVVEEIVKSFKSGKKNVASFWINMKGEKLLIQYFAVRDEKGNYKGVVEVSQEITEIQNLEGEKRLLDWTK